jgi:hypothetical protein
MCVHLLHVCIWVTTLGRFQKLYSPRAGLLTKDVSKTCFENVRNDSRPQELGALWLGWIDANDVVPPLSWLLQCRFEPPYVVQLFPLDTFLVIYEILDDMPSLFIEFLKSTL